MMLAFLAFALLTDAPVSPSRCGPCHPREVAGFLATPMGRSFGPISPSAAPEFTKPVQFLHPKTGRRYRVFRKGAEFVIEEFVTGVYLDSRRVSYFIGSGSHARSFLIERGDRIYEAPVTYYTQPGTWDMSPGYDSDQYTGFTRQITADCLYCHTGAAARPSAIDCARCHGPVEAHLNQPGKAIVNPAKLSPRLREQVCEQCHLMGAARVLLRGKEFTDYQPGQRLEQVVAAFGYEVPEAAAARVTGHPEQMKRSRCWQESQDRMWCGTCHDVHRTVAAPEKAAFYRARCLSCHQPADCTRPPDRQTDCAGCHMPKTGVLESAHVTFTDHEISRHPKARGTTAPRATTLRPLLPAPSNDDAARALGFAYLDVAGSTGRLDLLLTGMKTLEPLAPALASDPEYWQNVGEAHLRLGETAKAAAAFQRALELDPKSAKTLYSIGFLRHSEKRLVEAVELYRRATAADPAMMEAWKNLASALLALGQPAEAARAIDSALALEPGALELHRVREKIRR